jgi:hypothetical protein
LFNVGTPVLVGWSDGGLALNKATNAMTANTAAEKNA